MVTSLEQGFELIMAKAIFQGLEFVSDLSLHRIIVECDNKIVIEKINAQSLDFSETGTKIRDIKVLAGLFTFYEFCFVGRNGNQPAHALAVEGMKASLDRFWVEDAPVTILSLAAQDRCLVEPL
ncbi:hypothetical protein V6N13_118412 [Hibiscus sabdariffa]|uniref:RNase H type-1 domain-containing protein n=1 Tax=Hibiscus sabdariffa TaxID=183260 RepID=A0ABR2Q7U8_9ROSI